MDALKIDELTDDLVMDNGSFVWVSGMDELIQEIRSVLKTMIGEWFLDPAHGTDYRPLRGKKINEDEAKAAIRDALGQIDRITEIHTIDLNIDRSKRFMEVVIHVSAGDEEIREVMEF